MSSKNSPYQCRANIADFLLTAIEEKEKKVVGMSRKHFPIIPGFWKGVPKGTSIMPEFVLQTFMCISV